MVVGERSGRAHPRAADLADAAVAIGCLAAALTVLLTGVEATSQNRPVDALSVLLTVSALAPLAVRRRFPLPVLGVTAATLLTMMATRTAVGLAPLGAMVAFYTAVAWGSRRQGRVALGVMVTTAAATALLRPVDLSVEGIVVNGAVFTAAWLLGAGARDRRERFAAEVESLRERADLQRRLADAERDRADRAVTEERLRITRELHDVIGHAMSVMVVQAGVAERMLPADPDRAREAVRQIAGTGRGSLAEMRRLLTVLRDGDGADAAPREPAPTLASLPDLVARVGAAGLPVDLTSGSGEPASDRAELPPGIQLAAYRVVQEALTNCLKHAKASRAWVRVTAGAEALEITIRDDGVGIGTLASPGSGRGTSTSSGEPGTGVVGMRERVAMYGGEFSAGPGDGGYRVHAVFPVPAPDAAS